VVVAVINKIREKERKEMIAIKHKNAFYGDRLGVMGG
jgi:hypothetical protein